MKYYITLTLETIDTKSQPLDIPISSMTRVVEDLFLEGRAFVTLEDKEEYVFFRDLEVAQVKKLTPHIRKVKLK